MLYPLVLLSTIATVIASQAVISGAFSLTGQAVALDDFPRVRILQTSGEEIGQIYIPVINWLLMLSCVGLVLGFRSSSELAAAYGVAVSTDMVFTTILLAVVALTLWKWRIAAVVAGAALLLVVDSSFWFANLIKIPDGGWYPILIAIIVFTLMTTWKRGREILDSRLREQSLPTDLFLQSLATNPPSRVRGTAVFMFRNADGTPIALLHNLKHNKVLHETVVILSVVTEDQPHLSESDRVEVVPLGEGIWRVIARFGYMEDPDIPALLARADLGEIFVDPGDTSYFLGRETLLATSRPGMAIWREHLFSTMTRNARNAADFFRLPPNRVIELGLRSSSESARSGDQLIDSGSRPEEGLRRLASVPEGDGCAEDGLLTDQSHRSASALQSPRARRRAPIRETVRFAPADVHRRCGSPALRSFPRDRSSRRLHWSSSHDRAVENSRWSRG